MRESIHKYFKVGILQWMSYPGPGYDYLDSIQKIACDDYFDVIEMGGISDDGIRIKTKSLLDQSHLTVCYAAQPELLGSKLNPNAPMEEDRKIAEAALIRGVDEAESLGAGGISFVSGGWDMTSEELCYQQLIKTTKALCAYAGEKKMTVNLEVFDFDMDKEVLIGPAPLAARFAEDICQTWDNFGLLIDLSHIPTTHETSRFVIQTLKPYIRHLHIGNAVVKKGCEAYGDKHPRFGFPNSANDVEELTEFFKVLREEGFFRETDPLILSVEVKPWGNEDPDIIVANTKRVINRAWAMVQD